MDILEQAAQVLHEEAQAIEQLITTLDQSFVNAVNMILACK
ncbi:MAG: KpsF/GutQ family sugar-phosphate isomerase, partial [Veillonella sp.]|nr:KpsF/GutQ family sugar-phosphate isomerase [Veillonella sp.]